jgi:hypothetical protein
VKDTTKFDPVAEVLKADNEHIILMLLESVANYTEVGYQWLPRAVKRISSSCLKFILKHTFLERHPSLQAILDQILHNALVCMRFEIVTVLFNHGARINPENTTWFHRATGWSGSSEIPCKLLNRRIYPVDLPQRDGQTALHLAFTVGRRRAIRLLIDQGTDLNIQGYPEQTPLHKVVAWHGQDDLRLIQEKRSRLQTK